MQFALAIAALGLCVQASAAPLADLARKAETQGTTIEGLLATHPELGGGLPAWGEPAGDAAWYQRFKDAGIAAPEDLVDRLFPHRGRPGQGGGLRDGGDGPDDATPIEGVAWGTSYEDSGTTTDKTNQLGSGVTPPAFCFFNIFFDTFGASDAWYSLTLEEPTFVQVNTCNESTSYDSALGIFDADLNPVSIADDLDGCDWMFRSYLECCLEPGDYFIVVDGYSDGNVGDYLLEVDFDECPPDPCLAYGPLVVEATVPGTLDGDNTDFPNIIGGFGGDAGFDLTVPEAGVYSFRSCNMETVIDADLSLYTANPCDGGTLIVENLWGWCQGGANPDASDLQNVVLEAGTYHLVVGSGMIEGAFSVEVFSPCEAYDEAVTADTAPTTLSGSTVGEANIVGDSGGELGFDVTIPDAGFWDFDACQPGSAFDVQLWLYDASPCSGGQLIAEAVGSNCQAPWGAARLRDMELEAGVYHLTVGNQWGSEGAFEIVVQPTPDRPTSGGPDEMGYVWTSSEDAAGPTFDWIDISGTGTPVGLSDDNFAGPFAMGIDFPFYESVWNECYIGSNGFVSFGQGYTSLGNDMIPTPGDGWNPDDFVSMFWDDLNPGSGGTVYYLSDPGNGRFIVQFDAVPAFGGSVPLSFQAILQESGDILLQYLDLDEGDVGEATVGIENEDGTIGLNVNYNGDGAYLGDSVAIAFDALEGDFQPPTVQLPDLSPVVETELGTGTPVAAGITDLSGVASASLVYSVDDGAPQTLPMTQTEAVWLATIPNQDAGSFVAWHVVAVDASENANTRTTPDRFFQVVSYHVPPFGLVASDGNLSQTTLSWFAPFDEFGLERWFGGAFASEGDAIGRLEARFGLDKAEAVALWRRLNARQDAGRSFLEYNVYRDGELVGSTPTTFFVDDAANGAEADVVYSYTVTAAFDAGESDESNADDGYWGTPPTWGGPDAYGYTFVNSEHAGGPDYEFVDISSSGEPVGLTDDSSAGPFDLGFEMPWYGSTRSQCWIGSNGLVSFSQGWSFIGPMPIPTPTDGWSPDDYVAAFSTDLNPANGGTVYYLSDPAEDRFIVQFDHVNHYWDGGVFTFQVVLHASGLIDIAYDEMTDGQSNSYGAGIENQDGTIGLQYHLNGEGGTLAGGTLVRYLPPSSCEAVDCDGEAESEPNQGWEDGNASYEVIRCGETWCGTLENDGDAVDFDWYRYTHFGGDVVFSVEASDFDARLRLVEFEPDGAELDVADTFPRCFGEGLAVSGLASGTYFLVVEHAGAADLDGPQTYALTLECSGDPCAGHEPISCDGTPETEPNEGWNDDNASYGEIAFGETVCGTVWADGEDRDLDWFRFVLDATSDVRVSVDVDAFDAALFITDFDPEGSVVSTMDLAPPCHPEQLDALALPPGEYFVVVGHNELSGVPDPQAYALTLSLAVPEEAMCDNYMDGGTLGQDWYSVSRPAPAFAHHDGTGCPGAVSSPGRDEVHRLVLAQTTDVGVTLHGDGDADEVILLVGDCANPHSSCGAAVDASGAGTGAETMQALGLPAGDYYIVADFAGAGETHGYTITVRDLNSTVDPTQPLEFALHGAFPNPFNPATTIRWTQPELLPAELVVHNLLGEVVERIDLGFRGPGQQSFQWDASRLGSGLYLCTLRSGAHVETVKTMLIK